jgi:hypothetical protein
MALLLVSAALAVRANRRFQAALAILLLGASLVGLWSVTRIEIEIVDHEIFWLSGLGVLGLATVVGSALSEVLSADTPRLRWAPAICAAAFAIIAVLGVRHLWLRAHAPARLEQVAATKFGTALAGRIRATGHKPLIRIDQDAWPVATGLVASLTKEGLAFAVEDDWLPMFLESAKATGSEDEVISIVARKRFATLDGASQMSTVAAEDPYYMLAGEPGAR